MLLSATTSAQWLTSGFNIHNDYNLYPGNVGIHTNSPAYKLDIVTNAADGGMRVTQTNGYAGAAHLYLNNTGTNNGNTGRNWSLLSTGPANNVGAGHFVIYDMTGIAGVSQPRFFIRGGITSSAGFVGIGTTNPSARLHSVGTALGIKGDGGSNVNDIGVQGNGFFGVEGNGGQVGVRGFCSGAGNVGTRIGMRGWADGGATNIGGYFAATSGPAGVTSYGIYAGIVVPQNNATNYALYADASTINGTGTGPCYAGYFNGDIQVSAGSYYPSDRRLKKNIAKMDGSLNLISRLNPVTYNFDTQNNPSVSLPGVKQYGFISQEVLELIPEFTKVTIHPAKLDEDGKELYPQKEILSLNYNGFIALLTKGIQEQQSQIEDQAMVIEKQNKKIDLLEAQVNSLLSKTGSATGVNQGNTMDNSFALEQNIPNPFSNETVIRYDLPQQINNASLIIYDLSGKQITSFPLTEKGASSITITSEKLAAGIYIYSVMADGKILDSKRMVVAQKQ